MTEGHIAKKSGPLLQDVIVPIRTFDAEKGTLSAESSIPATKPTTGAQTKLAWELWPLWIATLDVA
jgi:hypothetical protein